MKDRAELLEMMLTEITEIKKIMIKNYENKKNKSVKTRLSKVVKNNENNEKDRYFKRGEIVYHRLICEHKEPLKVVEIKEDELLLEGDYSGGVYNVVVCNWLPIKGTSRVYNHAFKLNARKVAIDIETLAIPCAGSQDNTYRSMMDMVNAVMVLTTDVSLNPEF